MARPARRAGRGAQRMKIKNVNGYPARQPT